MDKTERTIIGLAIFNLILVSYEHQAARGWRPYLATLGILIIAIIFPPLALMTLIPLTGFNLLFNTRRIFPRKNQTKEGG